MRIKGMDISVWQGKISVANFKKAKDYGIQFVILRLGYTGSSNYTCKKDSVFENNYKNAIAAGLPVGVYYYSLANSASEGKREAEYVVKQIKDKKITWPVFVDMEDSAVRQYKCSKQTLAEVCDAFCKVVNKAGYQAGVYASLNWLNNKIGTVTEPHITWCAQYSKSCSYKGDYQIWQYSSSEGVPGIASRTDVNYAYEELGQTPDIKVVNAADYEKYSGEFPTLPVRGYFKRGDKGKQVKRLQLFLNWACDSDLVIDQCVGSKTIAAVEQFQKDTGLPVDGLFGRKCLKKAKELEL